MERIYIFDTTLRDGEQSPGAAMTLEQKYEMALQIEQLGVDVIEAGFPISSPLQFQACQRIAQGVTESTVAALARSLEKDIRSAAESIKKARHPRIHAFISTSPIHMVHKLRKQPSEVLEMIRNGVTLARKLCAEVEFSPEDATRSEIDFLCQAVEIAIDAGATIINIPDTVGYSTPTEIADLIMTIRNRVPNIDKAMLSIHCHDDLGLAAANTISALKAGARQAELTINGIGERAGNAALEEVVMALNVRNNFYGFETAIKTTQIYHTASMLSTMIGFPIARNKAVVGDNAFAHEAGIHQHGILAHRETYEIMTPESIGRSESRIVLGRHSGKHGFENRLKALNIVLNDNEREISYQRFLQVADRKTEIFDEDIIAIVGDELAEESSIYHLEYFQIQCGSTTVPSAVVRVRYGDTIRQESAIGDGPADAIFRAIGAALQMEIKLEKYNVRAVSPDTRALGEVSVTISSGGQQATGRGSSTDVLEAGAKAYLNAISYLQMMQEQ